uniref:Uncharacterized protein n=1 Tax=Cacopsylla melanoneura TaxID=428564 RepID=A0A8D8SPN9_9HEMI
MPIDPGVVGSIPGWGRKYLHPFVFYVIFYVTPWSAKLFCQKNRGAECRQTKFLLLQRGSSDSNVGSGLKFILGQNVQKRICFLDVISGLPLLFLSLSLLFSENLEISLSN